MVDGSVPLAHMPANQSTNHITTHLLYDGHQREETHTPTSAAATITITITITTITTTTTIIASSVGARACRYNSLSVRVVKVSHLLAAERASALPGACLRERAVFPALNFITCTRGISKATRMPPMPTTYDFIKARCCTSYTRACGIIQFNACIHTARQLLFRVRWPCFCEILGRRLRAEVTRRIPLFPIKRGPLSARYVCSLIARRKVDV